MNKLLRRNTSVLCQTVANHTTYFCMLLMIRAPVRTSPPVNYQMRKNYLLKTPCAKEDIFSPTYRVTSSSSSSSICSSPSVFLCLILLLGDLLMHKAIYIHSCFFSRQPYAVHEAIIMWYRGSK